MKTSKWLVISLVVVFSFACTLPTGNAPSPSQGGASPSVPLSPASDTPISVPPASDTPTPIPPASDMPTSTPPASNTPTPVTPEAGALQGGNVPAGFDIPSQNDPAPAGILEQLSWADVGGGEITQNCGSCEVEIVDNRISFSNFQPAQEVKARIYRKTGLNGCQYNTAAYVTTLSVRMDETGNFSASLSGSTKDLRVVSVLDNKTGNTIWKSYGIAYEQKTCSSSSPGSCPGAPPQRLKVNQMAYICTSGDSVKLREGPGKSYSTIQYFKPGEVVVVIDGPKCADNWSWWQVRNKGDVTGWMSEGGDQTDPYFLCPRP